MMRKSLQSVQIEKRLNRFENELILAQSLGDKEPLTQLNMLYFCTHIVFVVIV